MAIATARTKINEIAISLDLTEGELFRQALVSFLLEKKRQTLQLKLEILARYGADSVADLESKIAQGAVVEHPAWEDLIVAENLNARLRELDDHLNDLRSPENDRSQ
jgi:hypothetical protein